MNLKIISILLLIIPVAGCSQDSSVPSALTGLKISEGMSRSEVEQLVARTLMKESNYSAYGNNLQGGVVEYADGDTVLEVTYKPGAPAPWILNAEGQAQHFPPVDETVVSSRVHSKEGR